MAELDVLLAVQKLSEVNAASTNNIYLLVKEQNKEMKLKEVKSALQKCQEDNILQKYRTSYKFVQTLSGSKIKDSLPLIRSKMSSLDKKDSHDGKLNNTVPEF